MKRNQSWHTHAAIFDMDGVLVDTEPFYVEVNQQLFEKLGITMSIEEQLTFVGISSAEMWHTTREKFKLSQPVETLMQLETEAFCRKLKTLPNLTPMPGVVALIKTLRDSGSRLAIASSSSRIIIDLITARTGLDAYFDVIVSGEEVVHGKPNPEIFLTAAERLHVVPENCVVIEDSPHGVAGAKSANMRCVGFQNPNSGNQDLSQADLLIHDFSHENIQKIVDGNYPLNVVTYDKEEER
jgi:HAD superfamily hydrolase (TIGR01509 family)